jgi:hypothetical protein
MTEPTEMKAKGNRHARRTMNPENEARNLMDSYSKIFTQWKLHNDNYFKRVQVVMGILQVGLFLAVLRQLSPLPKSFAEGLIPIVLGILGILSALMWLKLNAKQGQYLEFCRRMLRNLEARLVKLGVPLEYFTAESFVFGPYREPPPELIAGVIEPVVLKRKKRHLLRFKWSNETYPDSKDNKGPHSIVKVTGGLISFEKVLAKGALGVWIVVIVAILLAQFL